MTSSTPRTSGGPLAGLQIVELAGLGAAPFCGMVLADLGANVIRVDRPPGSDPPLPGASWDLLNRGKRSIAVDLRDSGGVEIVLRLAETSDALIEGFRPGVVERLGVGPAQCLARNQRLVFGRMTGWGQDGPLAASAGHDIDYIGISGVLGAIGGQDPAIPLNLVGDFGGGGMLLAVGVLAAILSAVHTGDGQVVDASMVDGSALLATSHFGFLSEGWWSEKRSSNLLDGGAPFYSVYQTADGRHVAVGALETRFFAELLAGLEIDPASVGSQHERERWPELRAKIGEVFLSKSRDHWEQVFSGSDACVAPVLNLAEAPHHRHNVARGVFVSVDGVVQPGPAPRFSSTPAPAPRSPAEPGDSTDEVLTGLGYSRAEIGKLRARSTVF